MSHKIKMAAKNMHFFYGSFKALDDINLDFNLDSGDDFNIYRVTEYDINNREHPLNHIDKLPPTEESSIMIPARSITAISQVYLTENDPGIIY